MNPKYRQPQPILREEFERDMASQDQRVVSTALIRMALHESDWKWAERACLSMLSDPRKDVKVAALVGLGHLARIHRVLHLEIVVPAVTRLVNDAAVGGSAEDTLDDILMFVPEARGLDD